MHTSIKSIRTDHIKKTENKRKRKVENCIWKSGKAELDLYFLREKSVGDL